MSPGGLSRPAGLSLDDGGSLSDFPGRADGGDTGLALPWAARKADRRCAWPTSLASDQPGIRAEGWTGQGLMTFLMQRPPDAREDHRPPVRIGSPSSRFGRRWLYRVPRPGILPAQSSFNTCPGRAVRTGGVDAASQMPRAAA